MWTAIFSHEIDPDAPGKKNYLPSSNGRRCRFCLGDAAKLRFRKEAHAIPEAFGNHYLLSREECDACNERGSRLEDDLTKHLSVARAMSRICGKDGDVKHRFGNRPSSIESDSQNNRLVVVREIGDNSLVTRRTRTGLRYLIKVPGHRPLNIIKTLARMLLMLAPESELPNLEHIRKWVNSEIEWKDAVLDQGFIPGPGLQKVVVAADKSIGANADEANYRLAVVYGSVTFSLHLPGPSMVITAVPGPPKLQSPYPPYEVRWNRVKILADTVCRGRIDEVDVFVPALAALPSPSYEEIATVAYYRWLTRGAPLSQEGSLEDWLEAEQDLLWAQVPFSPAPGGPSQANSRMASC